MPSNSQQVFFDKENPEILRALMGELHVTMHVARKLLDLLNSSAVNVIGHFVKEESREEFFLWAASERERRLEERRLAKQISKGIAKRQARVRVLKALR